MNASSVVIIGQGYVGLPIAMRAVEVGHSVVGIDLDAARTAALQRGESYVEDIPDEVLRRALETGRYRALANYDSIGSFDVALITVPTPLRETLPDLSFIESAAESLAPLLRPGATVVLESTTYPGTTEELLTPILEAGSGLTAGRDLFIGYSPERIDPGNLKWTFTTTPKVVSGIDGPSLDRVQSFYDTLVSRTVPVSGTREAELTKLLENTFRHVNIALVNELAMFAQQLGVNVWEAIDAAATKPFGYMKFTPGPGVGGHCLPVDPSYLSWQVRRSLGRSFRFVELANDVNEHMPDYVVERVIELLNRHLRVLNGAHVLVMGLAYKKNSSDSRESPALRILELLATYGAKVVASDPHVPQANWPQGVERVDLTSASVADADLILLLTDHDSFDFALVENAALAGKIVFDTKNRLSTDGVHVL